jgi:hypothetical protein
MHPERVARRGRSAAASRFRVIRPFHPYRGRRDDGAKVFAKGLVRDVWPRPGITPYSREEAAGVLLAFGQRWLQTASWAPDCEEAWAEPVSARATQVDPACPQAGPRPPGSWTLRDWATDRLTWLAARHGRSLVELLRLPERACGLRDADLLYARALARTLLVEDPLRAA